VATAAAAAAGLVVLVVALLSLNNAQLREKEAVTKDALHRAKRNAHMVHEALHDVTFQMADERLRQDPNWTRQAEKFLGRTVRLYEDLARAEKDFDIRMEVARGFYSAAKLYEDLGNYDRAREVYRGGIDLAEQLEAERPGFGTVRRVLAECYRRV